MPLDITFLASDVIWAAFNGGTDWVKVIAEMRGGNGGNTGDVEIQLQRQDDTTGVRTVVDQENIRYSNQEEIDLTVTWDSVAGELTFTVVNLFTGATRTTVMSPVPFGNQGWAVMYIRAGVFGNTVTQQARLQTFNSTFNGISFGTNELDVDGDTITVGNRLANILALGEVDFVGSWTYNTTVVFTWGQNRVPPIPPETLSPGPDSGTYYPSGSLMNFEVKLADPPDGIQPPLGPAGINCLTEVEADPPTCAEATGDGCFHFRYECVGTEWVLDVAECIDNSLCTLAPLDRCTTVSYEFEELNTCTLGDPAPTPVNPTQFADCECNFGDELSTQFDGVDEYLSVPAALVGPLNFDRTDPFTIMYWAKFNSFPTGTGLIMDHSGAPPTNRGYWNGYSGGAGTPAPTWNLRHDGSVGDRILVVATAYTFPTATWVHVAWTYDGSSAAAGVTLYINGAATALTINTDALTGTTQTNDMLTMGARFDPGSGLPAFTIDGLLDEVAIAGAELSAAEVLEAYNGGDGAFDYQQSTFAADVLSWWRMGDGDVFPTILDQIGLSDQTMINMEAADFVADVP